MTQTDPSTIFDGCMDTSSSFWNIIPGRRELIKSSFREYMQKESFREKTYEGFRAFLAGKTWFPWLSNPQAHCAADTIMADTIMTKQLRQQWEKIAIKKKQKQQQIRKKKIQESALKETIYKKYLQGLSPLERLRVKEQRQKKSKQRETIRHHKNVQIHPISIFNLQQFASVPYRFDLCYADLYLQNASEFRQLFSQNMVRIDKNSASPTHIFTTSYMGRPIYIKQFEQLLCNGGKQIQDAINPDVYQLYYEKEVYRYIRQRSIKDTELRKHFLQLLVCISLPTTFVICSQDVQGVSLRDTQQNLSYQRGTMSTSIFYHTMAKFMFQNLYVLYLLHTRLGIVHNDLHGGNMIIYHDKDTTKTYKIFDQEYVLSDHPYYLMVYDFDRSSTIGGNDGSLEPNPITEFCKRSGSCRNPQKDLFLWFQLIHKKYISLEPNQWNVFVTELLTLCPELNNVLSYHKTRGVFWSAFCTSRISCENVHIPNFTLETIIPLFWRIFFSEIHPIQDSNL